MAYIFSTDILKHGKGGVALAKSGNFALLLIAQTEL